MSLRLPSTLLPKIGEGSRVALLTKPPDMPVLLQQHQDDHERTVSGVSPSVRRSDYRVEDHIARRVGFAPSRPVHY